VVVNEWTVVSCHYGEEHYRSPHPESQDATNARLTCLRREYAVVSASALVVSGKGCPT